MERLTIKTEKGAALKMGDTYPSEDAARKDLMQKYRIAVGRLAEYEDTGLTPKAIRELKGLWKAVFKLYGINAAGLSINNPLTLEELREMDGEPVWDARWSVWGLLDTGLCCVFTRKGDIDLNEALVERRLYRHKQEEGTL